MTVTIVLCGLDELFNLSLGQVLSTAKLTVRPAPQGNCSFLVVGFTSRRFGFAGILASYLSLICSYNSQFTSSNNRLECCSGIDSAPDLE